MEIQQMIFGFSDKLKAVPFEETWAVSAAVNFRGKPMSLFEQSANWETTDF